MTGKKSNFPLKKLRKLLSNNNFKKKIISPKCILNDKSNKWIKKFIKIFDIKNAENLILCEGLKGIMILNNKKKIFNPSLQHFIDCGWYKLLLKSEDKNAVLDVYLKSRSKKRGHVDVHPELRIQEVNMVKDKLAHKYNKKIWITFGVNDYLNWSKLNNAVNDALQISSFCKQYNFKTKSLFNDEFNKSAIEYYFKNFLYYHTDENDLVVMSFHCHGHTMDINGEVNGFIVPYDAEKNPTPDSLISMTELSLWCKYIKSKHLLLLFDCCFSGFSVLRSGKERRFTVNTVDNLLNLNSKIAINAGTHQQMVNDGGWGENSIFTGSIMSYPGFTDGYCSVLGLYNYLLENVPKHSNQTPTIGKLIGDQGGDIFLAL